MRKKGHPLMRLSMGALALGVLSIVLAGLSGPLNRFEILPFRGALLLFRAGATLGLGAAVVGGFAIIADLLRKSLRRHLLEAAVGFAFGLAVFSAGFAFKSRAESLPRIHDISTDLVDPPAFVTAVNQRRPEYNLLAYEGEAVASQQKTAYPDIEPVILNLSKNDAFDLALESARSLGWAIMEAERGEHDGAEGRIEAVDTTAFFGFKDDVVVRVRMKSPREARIDVRSVSRVGISDVGANAARIRRYMRRIRAIE